MSNKKILLTGASGFVGSYLSKVLNERGYEVIPLSRNKDSKGPYWNPALAEIDLKNYNFHGVINLAGENIMGIWTQAKKKKIRESRVEGTKLLAKAILELEHQPEFVISASAIGWYGDRENEELDEKSSHANDFLAQVCIDWEKASHILRTPKTRLLNIRIGVVLGEDGGALKHMLPSFKMGLGAIHGSGEQWMSWISREDVVKSIIFLMENNKLDGIFNVVSPNPETNEVFSKKLASSLGRSIFFKIPAFVIKLFAGEMGKTILISSTKVMPRRLIEAGFEFDYPIFDFYLKRFKK